MAWFNSVKIVDPRGKEHDFGAGPLRQIDVKQGQQALCVEKKDIFGIKSETTCFQQVPQVGVLGNR